MELLWLYNISSALNWRVSIEWNSISSAISTGIELGKVFLDELLICISTMRHFKYHVSESNLNHNEIILDLRIPREVARYAYVYFVSKINHLFNGEELDLIEHQIYQ